MDEIIENIKDTVEVLEVIKPIYNFKASDGKGKFGNVESTASENS